MGLGLWKVRIGAALLAVALGIGAAGFGAIGAGAAPGSGSISGRVTDAGGSPLADICVVSPGETPTVTDGSGLYSLTGVGSGDYKLHFSDCSPSPAFVSQWYLGRTDEGSADPVTVVDPADTALPDVILAAGVSVTGTVTDSGGSPIPNVNVGVNPTTPGPGGGGNTAADGTYSTAPLPSGGYKVQFSPSDPQYAGEYWNDRPSWNAADTLVLDTGNGPVHSGVDAQLGDAATIEGTVTDPGGSPISSICVDAAMPNGSGNWDWLTNTQTAGDGTYSIAGLPAVDVRIQFRDCTGGPYIEQWYSAQADFNSSTPIALTGGELRTGVDAQMATGTAVSGMVVDGSGNPIPDVNISVNSTGSGASAWAQTGPAGTYTTNALPPGDYRVRFNGTAGFASEYWNDKLAYNDADILTITGADGSVRGNVDAVLAAGATVSGRVTDSSGSPIQNICVDAAIPTGDGFDGVADAVTAADGTYTMNAVPAATVRVTFRDCNTVGPYVSQWWNDAANFQSAAPIPLAPGEARTGIDAQLAPAGAIKGRVTDGSGNPLENICTQASTPAFVGGMGRTDSNGDYAIVIPQPGDYRVQFVDCSGAAAFAGQWWNGQPTAATAQPVHVDPGATVTGIDATLAPGAPGTISGRVVNAGGTPMTSACVIAYVPFQFALFAPVQSDGTYTIPDVPSGTYALAFLGCGSGGDPQSTVPDPDIPGVEYSAFWWNGALLDIQGSDDGGPDPVAQGATLVTVTPGTALVGYDTCFGCDAIRITSITPGPNSLTVAFTTPFAGGGSSGLSASALANGSRVSVSGGTAVTYTVTCSSPGGGVKGSVSGPGSPITVTGLTSGASYICQVAAAAGGTVFATSAASNVLAAGSPAAAPGAAPDAASPTTGNPAATTGSLPRTGASTGAFARAGFVLLVFGLTLALSNRRRVHALSDAD